MDLFSAILGGFGISAPAGLNAWLPLLIVGLAGRFTHLIKLKAPFDTLTTTPVIIVLCILLLIEIFADKIPAVDTINDIIHTFIRPVAGGILFASYNGAVGGLDPALSFILGLVSAGSVHAAKATTRPLVTATTGGIGNPFVSMFEDFLAGVTTVIALVAPILAGLIMGVLLAVVFYLVWRWRARRRRNKAAGLIK